MKSKETIAEELKALQDRICTEMVRIDGKHFMEDAWERPGGGGGRSRIFSGGSILEKGGVNFSAVHGKTPEKILQALKLPEADFFATGVSIVMHPKNPWVPIIHMNVRFFEMTSGHWWFGGGIDLTPHYIDKRNASDFHKRLKQVCDGANKDFYKKYKKWADDYFYIPHRKETRGVGGIFFDRCQDDLSKDDWSEFIINVGDTFAPAYEEQVERNADKSFTEQERNWQEIRRSRYAEFNLVYDKGTKFGLETDGRIESILMSMPPTAQWLYDFRPEEGSKEWETLQLLKKNINWISFSDD